MYYGRRIESNYISVDICYREALCEIQHILWLWWIRRWRMRWPVQRQQVLTLALQHNHHRDSEPSIFITSQPAKRECWSQHRDALSCRSPRDRLPDRWLQLYGSVNVPVCVLVESCNSSHYTEPQFQRTRISMPTSSCVGSSLVRLSH